MMEQRLRLLNDAPVSRQGQYVLYWCRWNRRVPSNHAFAFAAGLANGMKLPLVVYQRTTAMYPAACDRFHTFELEGVPEFAAAVRALGGGFVFQLPREKRTAAEDRRAVFAGAAAVVTDDCLRATPKLDVQLTAVDGSCIVPMNAIPGRCYAAYSMRPKIHKLLAQHLKPVPPVTLRRECTLSFAGLHTEVAPSGIPGLVAACDIDHTVPPSTTFRGGRAEAERTLARFLDERLRRYARDKNEPSLHATSDLSPYLHYGHISSLEVALAVRERAKADKLIADEFLEELIVRRELAYNFARYAPQLNTLAVLPDWARQTIEAHRADEREAVYTRDEFERAATHDDLWNATQKELRLRGKIHGYYRMYWGKKILQWSKSAEEALATMLYLHDRYALDGDDPNTYTNILWCFGLHDRPWPDRPVFGTIRSMVRSGMERKTDVKSYIREIAYVELLGKERSG
jgi:deoxyribodipyrimidine photo-lyase